MNILGKSLVTYRQCESWIKGIGTANKLALEVLPLLWKSAVNNGIVPEILIAQAMIETGYFNFGGVLNASFHNTCGLKVTKGGGNYDANAHMRFASWEEGIQAHADHLALYAGAPNFPKYSPNCKSHPNNGCRANGTTADPRFSRATIVSTGDDQVLGQIEAQLMKLEDVLDVYANVKK